MQDLIPSTSPEDALNLKMNMENLQTLFTEEMLAKKGLKVFGEAQATAIKKLECWPRKDLRSLVRLKLLPLRRNLSNWYTAG